MQYAYNNEYLQALRENNPQVGHHLASSFSRQIKSGLHRRVHASGVAEDIAQETLLRVFMFFQKGKTLRTAASLPGFVRAVSAHVSLEMLRENAHHLAANYHTDQRLDFRADPENDALYQEQKEIARRALRNLPGRERYLINRLFLDEADRDQVCEELGVSRRYLRVLLHRAISHLRAVVSERM